MENTPNVDEKCPNGSFIQYCTVGTGNVSSSVPWSERLVPLPAVVFLQGSCSDGTMLGAITSSAEPHTKHDSVSNPLLKSTSGYNCSQLQVASNVNGARWLKRFLGTGDLVTDLTDTRPLNLSCASIDASDVAVGYQAKTGAAIDAVRFRMAAPPPGPPPKPLTVPEKVGMAVGICGAVFAAVASGIAIYRCKKGGKKGAGASNSDSPDVPNVPDAPISADDDADVAAATV